MTSPTQPYVRPCVCGHCEFCKRWVSDPAFRRSQITAPRPPPPLGLGDEVEALIKSVGADKLAELYEQVTGRPCGCAGRKALLNRLPAVLPKIKGLLGLS